MVPLDLHKLLCSAVVFRLLHLVHMMAVHTAFHNKLVTWGSGCTWSLGHVRDALIVLCIGRSWQALMDPHTLIALACYWSLLTGIDGPTHFKTSQLSQKLPGPQMRELHF